MYNINKLPDFYSVRNFEQIDYSLEGMSFKKCFAFFDNGFVSNVIESNKRDIRFIWDGFLLFVDREITLDDIRLGVDLYNSRLVALQRTNLFGEKFNGVDVKSYILDKLQEENIFVEMMDDYCDVGGYPSKCDLWSTRDYSVLIDAMDTTGSGKAYYFESPDFNFDIVFNTSNIPSFCYRHRGTIVLKGDSSIAISRLLQNDINLQQKIKEVIGQEKMYSALEGKDISGVEISKLRKIK